MLICWGREAEAEAEAVGEKGAVGIIFKCFAVLCWTVPC